MNTNQQFGQDLRQLEKQVDDLISACRRLREENANLKDRRDSLIEEKSKLAEKNRLARTRLENIVTRLRALERQQ